MEHYLITSATFLINWVVAFPLLRSVTQQQMHMCNNMSPHVFQCLYVYTVTCRLIMSLRAIFHLCKKTKMLSTKFAMLYNFVIDFFPISKRKRDILLYPAKEESHPQRSHHVVSLRFPIHLHKKYTITLIILKIFA